jgi:ABC-type transport system substrate-binding protein
MDPTAQVDPQSYLRLVYDSLIDVMMDLSYRPGLAVALPEQEGDRSYIFKLRQGVTFHDGTSFDAEAVRYNVDRVVGGKVVTPITGLWQDWLDKLTIVDSSTVRFDLKRPWPDFYWNMASTLFFGSPTLLEKHGPDYGTRPEATAGTGPFVMTSFSPRQKIELKRNPKYYREGEPYVDGVEGTFFASGSVRLLSLRRGELTNVYTFPESLLPLIEGAKNVVLKEGEASTLTVLVVNTKLPGLQDKRVRQAIQHAVDGDAIIKQVYRGRGKPILSMFPPWHQGFVEAHDLAPIRPDLAKAKALLAAAGYGPDNPLKVELQSYNAPAHVERAVLMQAQLKEAGIVVAVRSVPSGQAINNMQTGKYELSLWQMNGGPSLLDYSWNLFSGSSGLNNTFYNKEGGFQNPAIEPLLDTVSRAADPKKVEDEIRKIQQIAFDDLPYIYLNWRNHRDAWLVSEQNFTVSKLKNRQDYRTVWFDS